jgi:hypothetical protein
MINEEEKAARRIPGKVNLNVCPNAGQMNLRAQ